MSFALTMARLDFGTWLGLRRKQCKVSQGDIASALGIRRQTVSNWERNQAPPTLDPNQTFDLCALLNVDINTLARAFRGEIEVND